MNKRIYSYSVATLLLTAFMTPAFAEAGHDHDHKRTESEVNSAPSLTDDHSNGSAGHKKGHDHGSHSDEAHDDEEHNKGNSNESHGEGGHDYE